MLSVTGKICVSPTCKLCGQYSVRLLQVTLIVFWNLFIILGWHQQQQVTHVELLCFKSLLNIYHKMCSLHREEWELSEQCLGLWGILKGEGTWYEGPYVLAERMKENLLWKFKEWYEILTLPGADRFWTPLSEMNKICSEEAGIRNCRNRSCDTRYHKEYLQLLSSQFLNL